MKAKVINIISKEVNNSNAKYYVYKIIINKPIDKLIDGRMIIDNTFVLTEYARKYNVNASIVGKTIEFDIVYHKAGDTYKTSWGETLKFKDDCTQALLVDRKLARQRTGYTIQEQVMIEEECYIPKQW